jgi:hypothetical protein
MGPQSWALSIGSSRAARHSTSSRGYVGRGGPCPMGGRSGDQGRGHASARGGGGGGGRPTTDDGDSRIVGSAGCRGCLDRTLRFDPTGDPYEPPRNDVLTEGRRASDTRRPSCPRTTSSSWVSGARSSAELGFFSVQGRSLLGEDRSN